MIILIIAVVMIAVAAFLFMSGSKEPPPYQAPSPAAPPAEEPLTLRVPEPQTEPVFRGLRPPSAPRERTGFMTFLIIIMGLGALGMVLAALAGTVFMTAVEVPGAVKNLIQQSLFGTIMHMVLNVYLLVICFGLWGLASWARKQVVVAMVLFILLSVLNFAQSKKVVSSEEYKQHQLQQMEAAMREQVRQMGPEEQAQFETQMLPQIEQMVDAQFRLAKKALVIPYVFSGILNAFVIFYFSQSGIKQRFGEEIPLLTNPYGQ